jgi:hypothetical protein
MARRITIRRRVHVKGVIKTRTRVTSYTYPIIPSWDVETESDKEREPETDTDPQPMTDEERRKRRLSSGQT